MSSSSSQKPTIVLVPGAWHTTDCFDEVRRILERHEYPIEAVANPSIGAEPPTKGLADDAEAVRVVLRRLIEEEGKNVILLGHSYGGNVISCASEGLGSMEREKQGQRGGIQLLIYLAAFVLPSGRSLYDGLGGNWLSWMKFKGEYSYSSNENHVFYHDVEPVDQKKAISRLRHTSKNAFISPVTHEPWNTMQCGYIFCDDDQALVLAIQEQVFSILQHGSKEHSLPPPLTVHLAASHSPFLSMPGKTVEAIEDMITKVDGRGVKL